MTAVSVALFACSLKLKIGLINNSGETVTIFYDDETIPISNGGIAKFFYPTVARQRRFQVFLNGCTFTYEMPSSIENYSRLVDSNGGVRVQLERDSRLHLIPPASVGVATLSEVMYLQVDGFPVSPIEKYCE